jgi:hypothetical protein
MVSVGDLLGELGVFDLFSWVDGLVGGQGTVEDKGVEQMPFLLLAGTSWQVLDLG